MKKIAHYITIIMCSLALIATSCGPSRSGSKVEVDTLLSMQPKPTAPDTTKQITVAMPKPQEDANCYPITEAEHLWFDLTVVPEGSTSVEVNGSNKLVLEARNVTFRDRYDGEGTEKLPDTTYQPGLEEGTYYEIKICSNAGYTLYKGESFALTSAHFEIPHFATFQAADGYTINLINIHGPHGYSVVGKAVVLPTFPADPRDKTSQKTPTQDKKIINNFQKKA